MLKLRSKMGARGQAVIPKPVRDELGLRPGDEIFVHTGSGKAILEPATRRDAVEVFLRLGPKRRAPSRVDWHRELDARYE